MNMLRAVKFEAALVCCIILGLFAVTTAEGHCAVGRVNSLGVEIMADNPNVYIFGSIVDGTVLGNGHKQATNIRFNPARTPMLYSENVLFCGNQAEKFSNQPGPVIVIYRRAAPALYEGIACHQLIAVVPVSAPPESPLP